MSTAQAGSSPPRLQLDNDFSIGNFSFVSNNNVIFRFFDHQVFEKGNKKLTDAIKMCLSIPDTSASITLDQPSYIINHFLHIFLKARKPTTSILTIEIYSDLLKFADSLDAVDVMETLRPLLPLYLKLKRSDPYTIFKAAIVLQDWSLAGKAIGKHSQDHIWRRDHTVKSPMDLALGCKTGTFDLDPNGLPYHYWMEMPKRVSWALVRACADAKGWKERGQRFTVLMAHVDKRDTIFSKWAAMEKDRPRTEGSYDLGPGFNKRPSPDLGESSRQSSQLEPSTRSISSSSLNHSKRIKLRMEGREPLFLPGGTDSSSRGRTRAEIGRASSEESCERDLDLLDGP